MKFRIFLESLYYHNCQSLYIFTQQYPELSFGLFIASRFLYNLKLEQKIFGCVLHSPIVCKTIVYLASRSPDCLCISSHFTVVHRWVPVFIFSIQLFTVIYSLLDDFWVIRAVFKAVLHLSQHTDNTSLLTYTHKPLLVWIDPVYCHGILELLYLIFNFNVSFLVDEEAHECDVIGLEHSKSIMIQTSKC